MKVSAKILSILLYPMFIPTYAMGLLCWAVNWMGTPLPAFYVAYLIIGTLCFTCFIPLTAILILRQKGIIKDLYINDRTERSTPYIYSLLSMVAWWLFLCFVVKMPTIILLLAGGTIVTLLAVTLINLKWKISIHLACFGAFAGAITGYCYYIGFMPIWTISSVFLTALLLMYSRLYLQAHTPMQVVSGFLLGLLCTFLPALFI